MPTSSASRHHAAPLRVMPVCECFDDRSFGLSRAASSFTCHLTGVTVPEALSLRPISGREPDGLRVTSLEVASMIRFRARGVLERALECAADVVHFHGIWTMAIGQIAALQAHGIRVVVSPHGMLEDYILRRHRLRKMIFSYALQRRCLRQADVIHALSEHERQSIARYVGAPVPIAVIPNGVDRDELADAEGAPAPRRRFLFMGRLHEKKRLDMLLDAWSLAMVSGQAELIIAGNGEGAYAERIIARCNEIAGVSYVGYLSGAERLRALADSSFGILTSLSEGQPLGVLESLAYGRPCIVSTGCRMPMIVEQRLGWLGDDVLTIARAIRAACLLSGAEYRLMSQRCRVYVRRHHDWRENARQLSDLYHRVKESGSIPMAQEAAHSS